MNRLLWVTSRPKRRYYVKVCLRREGSRWSIVSMKTISARFDFNKAGMFSYQQAFSAVRKLRLTRKEAAEQFRRMVFNVVSKNLDDHTKNIAFLGLRRKNQRRNQQNRLFCEGNVAGKEIKRPS